MPHPTFIPRRGGVSPRVRVSFHTTYDILPPLRIWRAQEYKSLTTLVSPGPTSPQEPSNMPPLSKPVSAQPSNGARPVVTGPQPLRPLERRASQSAHRNRSPSAAASTSTAFHDLAHQGKKQLNQLMTFLDKGGNVKDGGRSDNALRQVRAKREADEAGVSCFILQYVEWH